MVRRPSVLAQPSFSIVTKHLALTSIEQPDRNSRTAGQGAEDYTRTAVPAEGEYQIRDGFALARVLSWTASTPRPRILSMALRVGTKLFALAKVQRMCVEASGMGQSGGEPEDEGSRPSRPCSKPRFNVRKIDIQHAYAPSARVAQYRPQPESRSSARVSRRLRRHLVRSEPRRRVAPEYGSDYHLRAIWRY